MNLYLRRLEYQQDPYTAAFHAAVNAKIRAAENWVYTKLTAAGAWLRDKWLDVKTWFNNTRLGQIRERNNIAAASNINPNGVAHENPLYEGGEENPSTYRLTIGELPGQEYSKGWAEDMSSESEEDPIAFSLFDGLRQKPSATAVVEADEDSMELALYNPLFDPN